MTYRQRRHCLRLARALRDADRAQAAAAQTALTDAIAVPADVGPPEYVMPDGTTEGYLSRALDAWLAAVARRSGRPPADSALVPLPVRVTPRAAQIASERGSAWVSERITRDT